MKKLFFAAFVFLGYNFSCNKNDETPQLTNAELILGNWKITAATYSPAYDLNSDGIPDVDGYAVMLSCEKDNIFSFVSGGVWKNDEGPTKCSPTDPQTITGTWILSADQKTITTDGDVGTILQLDNAVFKYSYQFVNGGTTHTVTVTMQRQ
jgi:hypothetical protein